MTSDRRKSSNAGTNDLSTPSFRPNVKIDLNSSRKYTSSSGEQSLKIQPQKRFVESDKILNRKIELPLLVRDRKLTDPQDP